MAVMSQVFVSQPTGCRTAPGSLSRRPEPAHFFSDDGAIPVSSNTLIDVTSTAGARLVSFLQGDPIVKGLEFPSVNRVLWGKWRYRPSDYSAVAPSIGPGKVQVYEDPTSDDPAYFNAPTGDFFILPVGYTDKLDLNLDVMVHEATHMVQDSKRLRLTKLEAEMDAHFAQALYRVRSGKTFSLPALQLIPFIIAAKEFAADAKYMLGGEFCRLRETMRSAIIEAYMHKHDDLTVKKRLDGVIL